MDIARARSPPALGRRPIGPRSPGKLGTLPVKNIIPLDLTSRLQEDIASIPRTTSPELLDAPSGSSRSASPASAPISSRPNTIRSESSASNGHRRTESNHSQSSQRGIGQQRTEETAHQEPQTDVAEVIGGADIPPTETEEGEMAPATRTSVSPTPNTDLDSSAVDGGIPTVDGSAGMGNSVPAAPDSPLLIDMFMSVSPNRPPQDTGTISPTDTASIDILDMYAPPPHLIVCPQDEVMPSASHPPSHQINGLSNVHDVNGVHSVYETDGVRFVNGVHELHGTHAHRRSLSEKSVQASTTALEPSSTPASTRASTPALFKHAPKRPPVAPPTAISFDMEPIKWKAMTLEAAQWTFTSEQLQETVSRAIRQSAAESFIRVVSTHTHDVELPQELERLESLRATTQAQYRFSMHRRAMLLQSLAALSQSQTDTDGEALYNLTTQLAELTSSCDRLMETLMRVADQKSQIQHVQDLHIASALAMALRKLNASYAKRTAELQETRARNEELKAELEEAWNMAQDMAQEMDDLDNFDLTFSDEEYTPDDDEPSTSALEAEIYNDMDRMSAVSSMRNAEVVEITGKAVVTKAVVTNLSGGGALKSGDRTSRVSAAKKRSSRASKASLRIPRTPKTPTNGNDERPDRTSIYSMRSMRSRLGRNRSQRRSGRGEPSEGAKHVPDVPIIRLPEPSRSREGSFLELAQTRPGSPAVVGAEAPPPTPPKEDAEPRIVMNIAATRSEEMLPVPYEVKSAPPMSDSLPTINYPDEEQQPQQKGPSWPGRKFFTRRVHSMQPRLRAVDDTADPAHMKRSASESKQFDGWPFLSTSKTQRFSVPVLSAIPLRGRKSSDSAPAGGSS